LSLDIAVPCGLIINELVSNSLKHAFPGKLNGNEKIEIILNKNKNNRIHLIIRDNGQGLPEDINLNETNSLGLRLAVILVEEQLEGTIDLNRKNGTEFQISFQAS
jgi:two-component sensor histidine kinase